MCVCVMCVVLYVDGYIWKYGMSVSGVYCLHAPARVCGELAVQAQLDTAHDEELVNSVSG